MNEYRRGDLIEAATPLGNVRAVMVNCIWDEDFFCIDIDTGKGIRILAKNIKGYAPFCRNFSIGQEVKVVPDLSDVVTHYCNSYMTEFEDKVVTIHHFGFNQESDDGGFFAVINEDSGTWSWWLDCLIPQSKLRAFLEQTKNE